MSCKTYHLIFVILLCSVTAFGQENESHNKTQVSTLLSPDGRFLAYGIPGYSEDGDCITRIIVCNPDGTEQKELQQAPVCDGEVQWLGNDRLVCTELVSNRYTVITLDGNTLEDIVLPADCYVFYKRLSPDGSKIAFIDSCKNAQGEKQYGLFVMELKTGEIRQLLDKAVKTAPAWSADSKLLAIGNAAGYVKNYPLVIVNVETNEITATEINGVGAAWSNDDKYLAFTTEIVRGGSWMYGIPCDGRIGVMDTKTRQITFITPAAHNVHDKEAGKWDLEGYLLPVWSPDGQWLACRKKGFLYASRAAEPNELDETWIANIQGQELKKAADGYGPIAWAKDSRSFYILKKNQLEQVDINDLNSRTLASWEKTVPPQPKPEDTIVIKKPGVVVEITWIDKTYGEAFANILFEARREYEQTFGLSLPETLTLQAQRQPQGTTKLWTDGEAYLFLTVESKEKLAPPARSGVFSVYGLCHELGHIAMYRRMRNFVGLPDGVGEGWAHYTGSVIVDAVAQRLGKDIWPEYYDAAAAEGSARLIKTIENKKFEDLEPMDCAAKVFYDLDLKYGRKTVGNAMNMALTEKPSGKELMPLFVQSLRKITADANAGDWIPKRVLEPQTQWKVKTRNVDDAFFADAKIVTDENGITLHYDDGTSEGKRSTSGSGHAVLFQKPDGDWLLDRIDIFGSRYGRPEDQNRTFTIYVCDENFNPVYEISKYYALFRRGEDKWNNLNIDPVKVPKRFYVCLSFEPTYNRGIYVAYDESVGRSHSFSALPYTHVFDVDGKYDWMIRAHFRKTIE
jgi:Tol biopolymer transport system component